MSYKIVLSSLFVLGIACFTSAQNDGTVQTPLDEFVYSEESLSQFSFEAVPDQDWSGFNPLTQTGFTAHVINMTSGNWRTEEEVSRPLWWHIIVLVIPDNLKPEYASHSGIYITGSTNEASDDTGIPDHDGSDMIIVSTIATGVGMPYAALFQVPNAHIVFADDPEQKSRSEDAIVAYTFDEHLNDTSRPELNVYMAMARAGVRSMDAITGFSEDNLTTKIEKFITSGASKRGWTTWLTGALAPDRVEAIIPVVWDGINLQEVFHQQYRDYGGWSFAIEDYIENHIVERCDTPEMTEMQNVIDPYFYRTRLTMPKVVVTGVMDEFQMPDDEQYWWNEMPGPKWLLKAPNTEHSYLTGVFEAIPVMGTWITYFLNDWEIPFLTWDYDEVTGDVVVHTHGGQVISATMWAADSCHNRRRDFRVITLDDPCECGPVFDGVCTSLQEIWHPYELTANSDGTYTGHVDPLDDGRWTAFIVSVQFSTEHSGADDPMHSFFTRTRPDGKWDIEPQPRWPFTPPGVLEFTSRGSIVPNTYPFPDCTQEGCAGELV